MRVQSWDASLTRMAAASAAPAASRIRPALSVLRAMAFRVTLRSTRASIPGVSGASATLWSASRPVGWSSTNLWSFRSAAFM